MSLIAKDLPALVMMLLPGFMAAGIFLRGFPMGAKAPRPNPYRTIHEASSTTGNGQSDGPVSEQKEEDDLATKIYFKVTPSLAPPPPPKQK